jgi:hypothetical protein
MTSFNSNWLTYPLFGNRPDQNNAIFGSVIKLSIVWGEQGWSVVAEWLGRRTLNQSVVGSNPGEGSINWPSNSGDHIDVNHIDVNQRP